MAQTGYTPLLIYSSSTVSQAPAAGNLTNSTLGSELAINITDGKLFYKDNANAVQVIAWKTTPTTAGGTGLTSYTAGDLLYYATGTTLTKLAIGASTNILTSSGSAPQWTAPSTITVGKATNLDGGAAGSVPYQSGAGATTFLGIGAANTVMTSSGSAPQWSTSLSLAGNVGAYSHTVSATQNVVTGGMWYQTSGGLLVMTPATTGGFAWNNYANTVQIASIDNSGNTVFNGTLTSGSNFLVNAGSGNPTITVKTAGAGNNPLYRIQADTNYWDMIGIFSNADDPFRIRYNGTDFFQIANTGGVSIGNTTDPGATNLSVTGYTKTGKINTDEGVSGSINNGATANIITLPAVGVYLVTARQDGAGNGGIRAAAIVAQGSSTNGLTSLAAVGGATLVSGAGFGVDLTNTAGGALVVRWSYTKLSS